MNPYLQTPLVFTDEGKRLAEEVLRILNTPRAAERVRVRKCVRTVLLAFVLASGMLLILAPPTWKTWLAVTAWPLGMLAVLPLLLIATVSVCIIVGQWIARDFFAAPEWAHACQQLQKLLDQHPGFQESLREANQKLARRMRALFDKMEKRDTP